MIDSPFFERGDEMSILDTIKKVMPYLKTDSGYVLCRLSSQAVEMDDGLTLEQKVTSLNSLIESKVDTSSVVNNALTTEEGFVLDARQGKVMDDKITELNGKLYNVSSDEMVVGKWIDGRNIYRKYIAFGQLNAASPMKKPHGIINIDRCIHIYGSARDTSIDSRYTVPLPFVSISSAAENFNVGVEDENVQIYFTGDKKQYSAMIILEYIKQSDA